MDDMRSIADTRSQLEELLDRLKTQRTNMRRGKNPAKELHTPTIDDATAIIADGEGLPELEPDERRARLSPSGQWLARALIAIDRMKSALGEPEPLPADVAEAMDQEPAA